MHNIYIDGSSQVQNKLIGIGIYDSSNGFELSMVKTGDNVYEAEYGALEEAIRYSKLNDIVKESRIFTDSQQIYSENRDYILSLGFVDFIWIPRELNVVANRLSTQYKDYSKSTKTKVVLDRFLRMSKYNSFETKHSGEYYDYCFPFTGELPYEA